MRNAETDLTEGTPWKIIMRFSIPLFFTFLLQQFYNMVDTIVVGQFLGKDALAGVGSTGAINFMIIGFCMGLANGFVIPVAQRYGAKDYKDMRRFVANSIWLTVFFAAIMSITVCILCRSVLIAMKTPADILDLAYDYIFIIFAGIPITLAYNLLTGIIRSLGDSKSPLIFLLMAAVANIGFDILSVTVLKLGVRGPAFATLLAQAFSVVLSLWCIKTKFPILKMEPGEWKLHGKHIGILCKMGIPMGLQYSITAIGSVVLQTGINTLGSAAVASVSAASKLSMFLACPFELSGGMQQRVGVAAAMLLKPKILLADEPTSALDVSIQKQVVEQMKMIREQYGTTILIVTHNIGVIRAMADSMLVLKDGKMKEYGKTQEVLSHPQSDYTKRLLAAIPVLRR